MLDIISVVYGIVIVMSPRPSPGRVLDDIFGVEVVGLHGHREAAPERVVPYLGHSAARGEGGGGR